MEEKFKKAKQIWLKGKMGEMNTQALFCARVARVPDATLTVTGADLYRITVNGTFVGYGPARAAHGYARVDRISLGRYLTEEENVLEIAVAGYVCASFYTLEQPSFLQAEVTDADGSVLCATGFDFEGYIDTRRAQKVLRYSYQRAFTEAWDLTKMPERTECEVLSLPLSYLERGVPYPLYTPHPAEPDAYRGKAAPAKREMYEQRFTAHEQLPNFTAFCKDELADMAYYECQARVYTDGEECALSGCRLSAGEYALVDLGKLRTGFLQVYLRTARSARYIVHFDEKLVDGGIDTGAIEMANVVSFRVPDGEQINESFEAYGFRYARLLVTEGELVLDGFRMRTYHYPITLSKPPFASDKLNKIYRAAEESFRQNALDVYMDCPTRERAGWLCDSYFTARAEMALAGDNPVERAFMENYRLYTPRFGIPKGMLPMCYPADHPDGVFIPQWAMWFVLQLEEYLERTPSARKEDYFALCYDLCAFLSAYENEDGLLERLPSWNFVEWSRANEWVQDVNYPTNMLYVGALRAIGNVYDDGDLLAKSDALKEKIIERAFGGAYFLDHAVRDRDGVLENVMEDVSETAQYYALKFLALDKNDTRFAPLFHAVLHDFTVDGEITLAGKKMEKANVFVGLYLKMELLYTLGEYDLLLRDIYAIFSGMAEKTGTLWEHKDPTHSLCHGFASYVAVLLKHIPGEFLV